jgi:hypothetical protein
MQEVIKHLDKTISHYSEEIKELMKEYLANPNENLLRLRMGYQLTLSELEKIKELITKQTP